MSRCTNLRYTINTFEMYGPAHEPSMAGDRRLPPAWLLLPDTDPMWVAFLRVVTFRQLIVSAFQYSVAVIISLPYVGRRRRSSLRHHRSRRFARIRLNC